MPSCKARGISHAILGQCTEYFELRRALLTGLTRKEMEFYGENAEEMIEDEVNLLHNFGPCPREEDCILLAGHLRLVQSLLSCDGVSKVIHSFTPSIHHSQFIHSSGQGWDGPHPDPARLLPLPRLEGDVVVDGGDAEPEQGGGGAAQVRHARLAHRGLLPPGRVGARLPAEPEVHHVRHRHHASLLRPGKQEHSSR